MAPAAQLRVIFHSWVHQLVRISSEPTWMLYLCVCVCCGGLFSTGQEGHLLHLACVLVELPLQPHQMCDCCCAAAARSAAVAAATLA